MFGLVKHMPFSQDAAGAATSISLLRPRAVRLIGLEIINWTRQERDSHHNPAQQRGMER